MAFHMFDPHIHQRLIVDTTLAGLNDIRATAEVAWYQAALTNICLGRQELTRAKVKVWRAEERKLATEGYMFRARIPSRIHHLVLDPSLPLSPDPPAHVPPIIASQGPPNPA